MRGIWPIKDAISTKKVFVGLSGGVDSAVSAALLQQKGYTVTGVFIRITIDGYPCTAGVDKIDAMRVAAHLKIPFRSIDLSDKYRERVFASSIAEFVQGRTPNPDALCNREIKFGLFFDWCMKEGADLVATGHYARTKNGQLYKGRDGDKDQSYFLWAVREQTLNKTIFPIGDLTKSEVRALAKNLRLPNAQRPDSQGLCFLGPISMETMLERELSLFPGEVVDEEGTVIGRHRGAASYTLGQRHGFELHTQTPHSKIHYVVAKDVTRNRITVSAQRMPHSASATSISLADINIIGAVEDGSCMARFRYRQNLIPSQLRGKHVLLDEPHYVPEGQSLVLYRNDRCLGGGTIATSELITRVDNR